MKKETITKIKDIAKKLDIKTIHIQGDNSNFFAEGEIEKNAVLFDDANEIAYALRVDKNFPNSRYRATGMDYDQIQYITLELSPEQLDQFVDLIAGDTNCDAEAIKDRFGKSPYDKRDLRKIKK